MNLNKLKSKLEKLEVENKDKQITEAWSRIANKKEILQSLYPDATVDPFWYYTEMLKNESDLNKLTERLFHLAKLDNSIAQRKLSQKKEAEYTQFKHSRNKMLKDTDWMVLPDIPVDKEKRTKILRYRKYLRDLPELVRKGIQDKLIVLSFEEWDKSPFNKDF